MDEKKQYPPFSKPYGGGEFSEKLAVLDDRFQRHVRDFDKLSNKIEDLSESVVAIEKNIVVLVEQRDAAKERLGRWKNLVISVSSALAIGLIIWLARLALIVQSSHLPSV